MLAHVTASEFAQKMSSGRTGPALLKCEAPDGAVLEVVTKFSASCEQHETNLAREAVAACLAGELGLPIPQPFLVHLPPDFVAAVPDPTFRDRMAQSTPVAFGSRHVTGGYSAWEPGSHLSEAMAQTAAAILTFDAIVGNPDRRTDNPNCLVKGHEIRIIDHELAFTGHLAIGWQPPWKLGALRDLERPGFHIFRQGLRGQAVDWESIRDRWSRLSAESLTAYEGVIPPEWAAASGTVAWALELIRGARENIDACLVEVRRVLG